MVRTNMVDGAAYRLCVEYKSMMDILVIIEGDDVEGHLEDVETHFIKISNFETLKSMSAYHKKSMETLKRDNHAGNCQGKGREPSTKY